MNIFLDRIMYNFSENNRHTAFLSMDTSMSTLLAEIQFTAGPKVNHLTHTSSGSLGSFPKNDYLFLPPTAAKSWRKVTSKTQGLHLPSLDWKLSGPAT